MPSQKYQYTAVFLDVVNCNKTTSVMADFRTSMHEAK